ncbi:acetoin reductase family protein [Mycena sanguinolenta]|nr:acetoin reductase family protein [Mycena sanguinolenta]
MPSKGIALVTGAAQGIGKAIALRLADDGFDVALNDLPAQAAKLLEVVGEIKAKGRLSSSHLADVTVEGQVSAMITEIVQVYGGIDVMVANAGVAKWAKLTDTSSAEWDRVMTINVRGTFLCYKHAGMQMIEQGRGGRIIGASSVAGKRAAAGLGAYSASKFAIRGLTQCAALEFGPHGITVNAYAPAAIESEMWKFDSLFVGFAYKRLKIFTGSDLDADFAKDTGRDPGTLTQAVKNSGALGRIGTSTDVASLVSFIASKESAFITGQTLSVNGGMYFD